MRMKIRNHGFAAVMAVVMLGLSGCSIKGAESASSDGVSQSAQQADIAAAPTNGAEGMDITRDEFLREYLYNLARYGYGTDTDEDTLSEIRRQVINSLIEDRVVRAKFAEYGLELSDDDRTEIQTEVDSGIDSMLESIKSAESSVDETLSDEELTARAQERYDLVLERCGVTRDTFYTWQETLVMKQKLTDLLGADIECTDDEVSSQLQALISLAKSQYENSPEEFNGQTCASVWLPDGSRTIQAILVGFDYDTYSSISELRSAGSDEEADALREQSLDGLQERYEAVMSGIVAGDDFAQLMEEFDEDEGNLTLIVTPGTEVYGKDIEECAMGIDQPGGTAAAVTDYGYYILRYAGDAVVSEDTLSESAEEIRKYSLETKKSELFDAELEKWKNEYSYEINNDAIVF